VHPAFSATDVKWIFKNVSINCEKAFKNHNLSFITPKMVKQIL
jgi:glycerol kinase